MRVEVVGVGLNFLKDYFGDSVSVLLRICDCRCACNFINNKGRLGLQFYRSRLVGRVIFVLDSLFV